MKSRVEKEKNKAPYNLGVAQSYGTTSQVQCHQAARTRSIDTCAWASQIEKCRYPIRQHATSHTRCCVLGSFLGVFGGKECVVLSKVARVDRGVRAPDLPHCDASFYGDER